MLTCMNPECNSRFEPVHSNHQYCSEECRWPYRFKLKCKSCEGEFRYKNPHKTYCSPDCKSEALALKSTQVWLGETIASIKGEGNANFKSRMPYLRKLSRMKYLDSDKPKECLVCGYDKHFDVAHVKDVKDFADDDLASEVNDLDNLIALCKNHHWEFDKDHLAITVNGQVIQK